MNIEERARVMAALGDPLRLEIADALTLSDLSPDSLAEHLGISSNLLSHHLRVLEVAGVITRSKSHNDRRRTYVHLREGVIPRALPQVIGQRPARVLFICTHNSARSILAEAMFRQASSVPCASAGTQPSSNIHPRTLATASRMGLSMKKSRPTALSRNLGRQDLVVSVCDAVREELGALPQKHIHWSIADPAEVNTDAAFSRAAAEIEKRVAVLAEQVN